MEPTKSTPVEIFLDQNVEWTEVEPPEDITGDIPYVVRSGVLRIGSDELRCYVLSNGQRIFDADDFGRFFGFMEAK